MTSGSLEIDAVPSMTPGSTDDQQQAFILAHTDLVRKIAYYYARGMPNHVDVDDLIQAGFVGLLEAAQRYDHRTKNAFGKYANSRIRGAILDFARKSARGPRSMYRRLRAIAQAKSRIEGETGEMARSATVAARLGMSVSEYHRTLQDEAASRLLSLDAPHPHENGATRSDVVDTAADPVDELARDDLRRSVAAAIDALPENERVIMLLYYDEEFLLREIGDVLQLTESRIAQLHKRAIERIRRRLDRQWTPSDSASG